MLVGLASALGAQVEATSGKSARKTTGTANPAVVELPNTPALSRIFAGGTPKNIAEFKAMEAHVQALLKKILPCTVRAGRTGRGGGASAVIVKGGFVLCAGHVTGSPGQSFTLTMHDGRRIRAKSLGRNTYTDSGILRITSKGDFPGLEMGDSKALKEGEWVVMLGFPGSRSADTGPPLRLGRVIKLVTRSNKYLTTDCTMSAGDSGGPLFDMQGRVIGTNSRINRNLELNMHVPIEAFHREWEWLVKGEKLSSGRPPEPGWLGMVGNHLAVGPTVGKVIDGSPASVAGIRVGDEILAFGWRKVRSARSIPREAKKLWPGDRVKIRFKRGGKTLVKTVVVGRPPAQPAARSGEGK